jgi:very-short-patch-repair endonuclease
MLTPERLIARIASGQLGIVTRQQLLAAGLSPRQIALRVAKGLLVAIHRGVYAVAGSPRSFEQKVLASCLATGGVASHRTAAALFGLRGIARPKAIDVAVDGRRAPKLEGIVPHTTRRLERTKVGVIPVTMPAQTLLDLAGVEPRLVEGALADALRRELVRLPALVRFLRDHARSGRPGGARLRALVEEHVKGREPTESWLEDRVIEVLRRYGLPEPVRQLRLAGMRFDFAYPWVKLDLEADSRLWHTSLADMRRDRERDTKVGELGWTVERITWLDLDERPAEVAARVGRWLSAQEVA